MLMGVSARTPQPVQQRGSDVRLRHNIARRARMFFHAGYTKEKAHELCKTRKLALPVFACDARRALSPLPRRKRRADPPSLPVKRAPAAS